MRTCNGTIHAMTSLSTKCALTTKRRVPQIRKTMNTIGTRMSFRLASWTIPCLFCAELTEALSHHCICLSHNNNTVSQAMVLVIECAQDITVL